MSSCHHHPSVIFQLQPVSPTATPEAGLRGSDVPFPNVDLGSRQEKGSPSLPEIKVLPDLQVKPL